MDSVTTSKDTQPSPSGRIETTSIDLPDGWRGRVTVSCHSRTLEDGLPLTTEWRTILQAFVRDPFSLSDSVTLKYVPGAEVLRGTIPHGGGTLTVIAKHHTGLDPHAIRTMKRATPLMLNL